MPTGLKWIALVAVVMTGCVPPQQRRVSRAALVPHLAPSLLDGAPMERAVELAAGLASVAHATSPRPGDGSAAVEVPGTQFAASLRRRFLDYMSIEFMFQAGLDSTARPIKRTEAPVDGGDVLGRGLALTLAVPVGRGWSLGIEGGLMVWSVPWVEHSTCVANCPVGEPINSTTEGTSTVAQGRLAVIPTYRSGDWTVFGGLSVANQPTIEQKDTEFGTPADDDGDVDGGPAVWMWSAGLSARVVGELRASAIVYAPLERGPVAYGPSMAAMLTLPLGSRTPPP